MADPVDLEHIDLAGVVPPEAIDAPPVALPPGHITVLNPDGVQGSVPNDWFWKEGHTKGYSLPSKPVEIKDEDITPDTNEISVYNEQGQLGSLPLDWFKQHGASKGYRPASSVNPEELTAHQERVNKELTSLKDLQGKKLSDVGKAFEKLNAAHKNDDIQDKEGNYKMLSPNGEIILVPADKVATALAGKLKFKDDNFQALVDARVQNQEKDEWGRDRSFLTGESNALSFGVGDWLRSRQNKNLDSSPLVKAQNIANQLSEEAIHPTAHAAGAVTGIAAQLINPGGAVGELGAAELAGGAIRGAKALESSPLIARALAGAVEGAIISSPNVIAQAVIQKDLGGAAEGLAMGIGLGGMLGVGGGLASKLLSTSAEKLVGAEARATKVEGALRGLGATDESLQKVEAAQREPFLKTLLERGLNSKDTPDKMATVLEKLKVGDGLVPTLTKLDEAGAKVAANPLLAKLGAAEGGQLALFAEGKVGPTMNKISQDLQKYADKSGNVSLSNLQKFLAEQAGEINWKKTDDAVNTLRQQVVNEGMKELVSSADKLVTDGGVNAKLATAWAEGKSIAQISNEMHTQFVADIVAGHLDQRTNTLFKGILMGLDKGIKGGVAAVGHAVGGPLGGYAAYKGAAKAATGATDAIEHYIMNPANNSKLTSWLKTNRASSAIGSYTALDAVHSVNQRVQEVAPFLKQLSDPVVARAMKLPSVFEAHQDPIKAMLGTQANGLSKKQQFSRLSNMTSSLVGNPQVMDRHLDDLTGPFADHPELREKMKQDMNNKIQWLHQVLHSNNQAAPTPFQKQKDYQPSKTDLKDMEDQIKIAQNPFALLDGLKNGKVTAKQVATASVLNPAILSQIRQEIAKEAHTGNANLSYQQRLSASVIMGQAMDKSLQATPALQGVYNGQQQPQQQGMPPQGKQGNNGRSPFAVGGKAPKLNASKMPAAQGTLAQRLMGK